MKSFSQWGGACLMTLAMALGLSATARGDEGETGITDRSTRPCVACSAASCAEQQDPPLGLLPGPIGDSPTAGAFGPSSIPIYSAPIFGTRFVLGYTNYNISPQLIFGSAKLTDNTSPIPQDRFIFDYSGYSGADTLLGRNAANSFSPGIEKTFFGGLASIEVRMPMNLSPDPSQTVDGTPNLSAGQWGDIMVTSKLVVYQDKELAVSAGIRTVLPTAPDIQLQQSDGTVLVDVKNQSIRLDPFIGFLWVPNDKFFLQGFLQYDVDANGSPVLMPDGPGTSTLAETGRIHSMLFQYIDISAARWLYKNPHAIIHGIAAVAELHWNQGLQPGEYATAPYDPNFIFGNTATSVSSLDMTVGAHVLLSENNTLSLGYVTPIGNRAAQPFDGEFRLTLNHFFGPRTGE